MATLKPEYETPATRLATSRRVGVAVPLRATAAGGLARVYGEDHDFKIIASALMGHTNDNPFQQPSTDIEDGLFDIADPAAHALIVRRVEDAFEEFERQHRYRLLPGTTQIRTNENGTFVILKYHNLESDETRAVSVPVEGF